MAWPYRYNRRPVGAPQGAWNTTREPADPAALAAAKARIEKIQLDPNFASITGKNAEFFASVKSQIDAGRVPSSAQDAWISRIEKALVPADTSYYDPTDADQAAKRDFTIRHYKAAGYFQSVIAAMEANPSYMPDVAVYEKMWANRFIGAAFKRYTAGIKCDAGDLVTIKRKYVDAFDAVVISTEYSNQGWWHAKVLCITGSWAGKEVSFRSDDVKIKAAPKAPKAKKPSTRKPRAKKGV